MRVRSLRVLNFRAIEAATFDDLREFVLIAGPNGCGKTTVLDALRLIKSLYVADEWQRWLGEFGINSEAPTNFHTLFRDTGRPAVISVKVELSQSEVAFLLSHAANIAAGLIYNQKNQRKKVITGESVVTLTGQPEIATKEDAKAAKSLADRLRAALEKSPIFDASVTITMRPFMEQQNSVVAAAAFSCYAPSRLGELEFHSSRRSYAARETINQVNLNLVNRSEERRNRLLYDIDNKYKNIKAQLVEEYLTTILRREDPSDAPLQRSIKELFQTFFPGKQFLGVSLGSNNALAFPVRLSTGETHDIDELSSGEKEIVYGYLWLRTGVPPQSVILIDEPELHLNPALVQGLVTFYKRNVSEALKSQVWIVTHSDAILRQGVRTPSTAVFHMARPVGDGSDQVVRIDSKDKVEAAVLDLVGDMAQYRPHARIVLVEGHKDTRFDVEMIVRLLPDLAERATLISAGPRRMVNDVRERLLEVLQEAGLTGRAVSITDSDFGLGAKPPVEGEFRWPVYEIEKFLLAPSILCEAVRMMRRTQPYISDNLVVDALRRIARGLVSELAMVEVRYLMRTRANQGITIGGKSLDSLVASGRSTKRRIKGSDFSRRTIKSLIAQSAARMNAIVASDEFLQRFPGDRLLREFAGLHGIPAEHFRNVCLEAAQLSGYRPAGMENTLRSALT